MIVRSSLKSLLARDKKCKIVKRRGRIYIIHPTEKRYKARQG